MVYIGVSVGESMSLVEMFLHGQGGQHMRGLLAQGDLLDDDPCPLLTHVFLPVVSTATTLLYPCLT